MVSGSAAAYAGADGFADETAAVVDVVAADVAVVESAAVGAGGGSPEL